MSCQGSYPAGGCPTVTTTTDPASLPRDATHHLAFTGAGYTIVIACIGLYLIALGVMLVRGSRLRDLIPWWDQ